MNKVQNIITKILVIAVVIVGLGILILPSGSHANTCPTLTDGSGSPMSVSCDVNVSANVGKVISLEIIDADSGQGTDGDPYIISIVGEVNKTNIDDPKTFTAKVSTNNLSGYNLTVIDKDNENSLVHTANPEKYKIPSCTNLNTTPIVSCWALKADYIGSHGDKVNSQTSYSVVPPASSTTGPLNLVWYHDAVTDPIVDDETAISIGLSISAAQAAGTYKDQILITATPRD